MAGFKNWLLSKVWRTGRHGARILVLGGVPNLPKIHQGTQNLLGDACFQPSILTIVTPSKYFILFLMNLEFWGATPASTHIAWGSRCCLHRNEGPDLGAKYGYKVRELGHDPMLSTGYLQAWCALWYCWPMKLSHTHTTTTTTPCFTDCSFFGLRRGIKCILCLADHHQKSTTSNLFEDESFFRAKIRPTSQNSNVHATGTSPSFPGRQTFLLHQKVSKTLEDYETSFT